MVSDLEMALRVIRDECKKHITCHECPLRHDDLRCTLAQRNPENWELASDPVSTTDGRVFRN